MIVIVGGGLSGLYSAYRIKQKHPNENVCIFEASRLGGRIKTIKTNKFLHDAGAWRIHSSHTKMLNLANELNINVIKSSAQPHNRIIDPQLKISKPKLTKNQLHFSIKETLAYSYTPEQINKIERSTGYIDTLNGLRRTYAVSSKEGKSSGTFFRPTCGMEEFINKLTDKCKKMGVFIYKYTRVFV